jgi:hypothetical protein
MYCDQLFFITFMVFSIAVDQYHPTIVEAPVVLATAVYVHTGLGLDQDQGRTVEG